jgi:hypothetical protein
MPFQSVVSVFSVTQHLSFTIAFIKNSKYAHCSIESLINALSLTITSLGLYEKITGEGSLLHDIIKIRIDMNGMCFISLELFFEH